MPELPEVETVRRGLEQAMLGRRITEVILRRENLRFPFPDEFASRITGRRVDSIRRRAKYLLLDLDDGRIILSHLGMSGRYTLFDAEKVKQFEAAKNEASRFGSATGFEGRHDHVEFRFDDGSVAVYTDPRRFGIMDLIEVGEEQIHPLLESLGPEPFGDWSAKQLAKKLQNKTTSIKIALLDQRVVVGVGNIYACEALHRSGIHPQRQSKTLVRKDGKPTKKLQYLHENVVQVLEQAVEVGGSSLNDFADVNGTL
ncbi:MAG: bifunctional DNA-formamidopyrimidine glycosylase/DNA-(apurinic or apyrimidinic site) lyase, partial [Candidatus Thermoplasmatota archaeon]|nr:bifunctional DNA-formamidopyrimidine glycosylase/DNA-(apurinic or apyrimidinic site) lyase [Candidatus Thermoplasmatota archaeon]